jgi:hypothetical protein
MSRYANVTATVALFASLGGGAYAATQLPKHSVGTRQLRASAVTSSKVADNTLEADDFSSGVLPRPHDNKVYNAAGPVDRPNQGFHVPPGNYVAFGSIIAANYSQTTAADAECQVHSISDPAKGHSGVGDSNVPPGSGQNERTQSVYAQSVVSLPNGGEILLDCTALSGELTFRSAQLFAVEVGDIQG